MTKADPHISLAGFSLWIHGYQYPDSREYWDANWLNITATCIGEQSRATMSDSCLRTVELEQWATACELLAAGNARESRLPTLEPYLEISIDYSGEFDRLAVRVKLQADYINECHRWRFPIDQSYVARLIQDLRRALAEFPVRGRE